MKGSNPESPGEATWMVMTDNLAPATAAQLVCAVNRTLSVKSIP
jgi:hypothetical protein